MGFDSIYRLSVILNLIDNMTSPAQNVFGSMMKTGTMLTGAGVQLAQALTAPVTASFDTKSAIAELSSLGVEELALLESAANDFPIPGRVQPKQILYPPPMILKVVLLL